MYFPKRTFSKVQLPNSKVCNFPSGNFQKVRPSEAPQGPSAAARMVKWAERRGKNKLRDLALRLGQTWEVTARENWTFWKLPLRKIPLGSCLLGKSFRKVPNILFKEWRGSNRELKGVGLQSGEWRGWGVLRGGNQGVKWSYSGLQGLEMVIKE